MARSKHVRNRYSVTPGSSQYPCPSSIHVSPQNKRSARGTRSSCATCGCGTYQEAHYLDRRPTFTLQKQTMSWTVVDPRILHVTLLPPSRHASGMQYCRNPARVYDEALRAAGVIGLGSRQRKRGAVAKGGRAACAYQNPPEGDPLQLTSDSTAGITVWHDHTIQAQHLTHAPSGLHPASDYRSSDGSLSQNDHDVFLARTENELEQGELV